MRLADVSPQIATVSLREWPQMRQRAALGVQAQVRISLVNLLVAVPADLPAHIRWHIGIRQLGNERVTQTVKAERLELPSLATLFSAPIALDFRLRHHPLKHRGKAVIPARALE